MILKCVAFTVNPWDSSSGQALALLYAPVEKHQTHTRPPRRDPRPESHGGVRGLIWRGLGSNQGRAVNGASGHTHTHGPIIMCPPTFHMAVLDAMVHTLIAAESPLVSVGRDHHVVPERRPSEARRSRVC